ncbi:hypothetical protein WMF26_20485 [Sorangium sp. So ce185]|uniref:hypothetical protein n=1 Tax=Sorangium sp. So ce185 TaxID=3133287 RepID=UPI003F5E6230
MLLDVLGIQVLLQVGPTLPLPAPFPVAEALRSIEVRMSNDGRDGFQLTFAVGHDTPVDASLVASGILEPPSRIVVSLLMGAMPEVLIDGIITDVQFSASPEPGQSTLHVTGEDLTLMMDLEEKNRTFELRPDAAIVTEILAPYMARFQIVPAITPTADVPLSTQRMPSQHGTDLAHVRHLASRNGFVFYVEPMLPGVSRAYWGPDAPTSVQPAINVGMDSHRSSEGALQGRFDALSASTPVVTVTEPNTGVEIPIPVPQLLAVPPVVRPAAPMRRTLARNTAGLSPVQAALEGFASAARGSDPVRVSGEVDGVRYRSVLRTRRLVGVRGMGLTWDGLYAVEQVTHRLQRGEYKQQFTLKRSGFISPIPVVMP